jgi:hypothetical protein
MTTLTIPMLGTPRPPSRSTAPASRFLVRRGMTMEHTPSHSTELSQARMMGEVPWTCLNNHSTPPSVCRWAYTPSSSPTLRKVNTSTLTTSRSKSVTAKLGEHTPLQCLPTCTHHRIYRSCLLHRPPSSVVTLDDIHANITYSGWSKELPPSTGEWHMNTYQ